MENINTVNIFKIKQVKFYLQNGIQPINVSYNADYDAVIFTFNKADTQEVYSLWKERGTKIRELVATEQNN